MKDLKTSRWEGRALPVALVVVLAGLLVASAVLWAGQREPSRNAPVAVAREQAVNFFSLDHRNAEQGVDRVLKLATGAFRKEYADQRDAVIKAVKQKRLVTTATVPDKGAAVEYFHGDRAEVLVAVDVTSKGPTGAATEKQYRTRVELSRVDGTWLVSGLSQVG